MSYLSDKIQKALATIEHPVTAMETVASDATTAVKADFEAFKTDMQNKVASAFVAAKQDFTETKNEFETSKTALEARLIALETEVSNLKKGN